MLAPPALSQKPALLGQSVQDWVLRAATLVVFELVILHLYALERPVKIDEGGFLNPILEYVHHGQVVYPAHGPDHAHSMIIHPPIHYWLVGVLIKMGLDFYPAAVTLPLIATAVLFLAILTAPWSNIFKISFIFGAFIPNILLIDLDPSRSELQMALAWLAGLVFLESARLEGWRPVKLVLGSFLLAYASGLHYFAAPAVAGCGVYLVWAIADRGFRRALPALGLIIGGAALFLLPYAVLFVIPEYSAIRDLITALNAADNPLTSGWLKAFQYHRDTYPASYGYMDPSPAIHQSVFLALLKPMLMARIPVVFFSTAILLWFRQTRALALAALPFQLGLLFFSLHKSLPYYRGEFSLFYAALFAGLFSSLVWLLKRLKVARADDGVSLFAVALLLLIAVVDSPVWQIPKGAGFVDELALSRAAGKMLLGENAVVGGRSVCLWYISGAKYYRNVTGDLIYPPDISALDPASYFSVFDGIAEEAQGSYVTYNRQKSSLPSWYLNGTLALQGFYAGRDLHGSRSGYLLAGPRRKVPVQAWFWRERTFLHFVEDPQGSSALIAIVSSHANAFASPEDGSGSLLSLGLPPDSQDYLTFHVIPQTGPAELQAKLAPGATVRDLVRGRVEKGDVQAMLRTVDYHREMTDIFYNNEELLATQVVPDPGQLAVPVPLGNANQAGAMKTTESSSGNLTYSIDQVQSVPLLYSPDVDLKPGGLYTLSFDLRLREGHLMVSVTGAERKTLIQFPYTHSQPFLRKSIVLDADKNPTMQLMVWANNATPAQTKLDIRNIRFQKVNWIRK